MPKGVYERTEEINIKNSEARKGEKNPNWRGGQFTDNDGYVLILKPDHPKANINGYIRRSHLVAEEMLGRYLYPEEVTHHKNGIKDDDKPENIKVMTKGEHQSFHRKEEKKMKKSKREIGNSFQRWIRDWLRDRSWTVHNFPMISRSPIEIPDPKNPRIKKLIWLSQDNDVFGCDLIGMKGSRRIWIQSSLDEHIQRRLDEFAKYWDEIAPSEDLMLWIKREKWISVFVIKIQGGAKKKLLYLGPGGKIIRGRWSPDPGIPEWYFGEKIKKEKKSPIWKNLKERK